MLVGSTDDNAELSRSTDDAKAVKPIAEDTMYRIFKSHFSGCMEACTLSYATEIMVPSFNIVIVTSAMTGIAKCCGQDSLN